MFLWKVKKKKIESWILAFFFLEYITKQGNIWLKPYLLGQQHRAMGGNEHEIMARGKKADRQDLNMGWMIHNKRRQLVVEGILSGREGGGRKSGHDIPSHESRMDDGIQKTKATRLKA